MQYWLVYYMSRQQYEGAKLMDAVPYRWGSCQEGDIHQPAEEEQPWAPGSVLHRPAAVYTPQHIRFCAGA